MRVAFFFDNRTLGRAWSLNIRKQAFSGTDGTFLQVYLGLKERGEQAVLLCSRLPEDAGEGIAVTDTLGDAYRYCELNKIDFLVYIAKSDKTQIELLNSIKQSDVKLVAWAQNTPSFQWFTAASQCSAFYKLIAVSNVQLYGIAYHPVYYKTAVIFNFIDDELSKAVVHKNPENVLLYVGALTPNKGFHHIAEVWPAIHRQQPDVKLYVCGSPGLYNANAVLGPEGIAEQAFESKILSFLGGTRESAQKLNVEFLGSLPKNELYEKMANARMVLVNPNMPNDGSTETFCVSAIEAMVHKTPVVGAAAGGLLEVVGNKGGLLANNKTELKENILRLISDDNTHSKFAESGRERVVAFFTREAALNRWQQLIHLTLKEPGVDTGVNFQNTQFVMKSAYRILVPLSLSGRIKKFKQQLNKLLR